MNFAKLFAAGRGLAGGKGQPSPFRVNQRLLPKFNEDRVSRFERTSPPPSPRADLFQTKRTPAPEVATTTERELGPEVFGDVSEGRSGMEESAAQPEMTQEEVSRPFFQQAVRKRKPTQARLQQAELELERVRVVRNDLEDSDLELVAVAARRRKSTGVAPSARSAGTVWGWVTDNLFKSNAA